MTTKGIWFSTSQSKQDEGLSGAGLADREEHVRQVGPERRIELHLRGLGGASVLE
jgi:hypothetical protein